MRKKFLLFVLFVLCLFYFLGSRLCFYSGLNNYNNKNYAEAVRLFEISLALPLHNKECRYYYVQSLSHLKPDYYIQKKVYTIYADSVNDEASKFAGEKVLKWRNNLMIKIGKNYIEYAPADSNLIRWNKSSFPLKFYVDNFHEVPPYYGATIKKALNSWRNTIDFVSFEETSSKNDAKIIFELQPLPADACQGKVCKYVVAYTSPVVVRGHLKNMLITVYDKNPSGGYFSDIELYNTVLHEIGHALGIMGHSATKSDLMYQESRNKKFVRAFTDDYHGLTSRDINTIKLLYMLEPDITDVYDHDKSKLIYTPVILGNKMQRASQKLKEAQIYIKKSPNITAGYVNLAAAYMELGNNKDALKALNKAENLAKDNTEKYSVYYNLAYLYLSMHKYDKALHYADKAKNYNSSQDLFELIEIIKSNM